MAIRLVPLLLQPLERVPDWVVQLRATWERGPAQREALDELDRRGIWLTPTQYQQARQPLTEARI